MEGWCPASRQGGFQEGGAGPDAASRRHCPPVVSTVTSSSVASGSGLTTQAGGGCFQEVPIPG